MEKRGRLIGVISLIFLLLASSVFAYTTYTDSELISSAKLGPIAKGFGSNELIDRTGVGDPYVYAQYKDKVPASAIDSIPDSQYEDTIYYNAIHVADAYGRPKYEFSEDDKIYLKDRRVEISRDDFDPQYEYTAWANLYEPGILVDVYLIFDLIFRDSDINRFNLLKSVTAESRTEGQLWIAKYTIRVDSDGRIPFTPLDSLNDMIEASKLAPAERTGFHGTYNFADTPGNRLSNSLTYPGKRTAFDLFIDADRNGHFDPFGETYYQTGFGYRRSDSDYYTYGESHAFVVLADTPRPGPNCCTCVGAQQSRPEYVDIYECNQWCSDQDRETVLWQPGTCPAELDRPPVDIGEPEVRFMLVKGSAELLPPTSFANYLKQTISPSKKYIGYRTYTKGPSYMLLDDYGQTFQVDADLISYNEDAHVLAYSVGPAVSIVDISPTMDGFVGTLQKRVKKIWDPSILLAGGKRFSSSPTTLEVLDGGNIAMRDHDNQVYTLLWNEPSLRASVVPAPMTFTIKSIPADQGFMHRIAYDANGALVALVDEQRQVIDVTPQFIDYSPSTGLLGVVTSSNGIQLYRIKQDTGTYGSLLTEVNTVVDSRLRLIGGGQFQGTAPTGIRVLENGNLLLKDEAYIEHEVAFTDANIIDMSMVLLREGYHPGALLGIVEEIEPAPGDIIIDIVTEVEHGRMPATIAGVPTDSVLIATLMALAVLVLCWLLIRPSRYQGKI